MNLKKYFTEAQEEANENFFNADGWEDDYDFADEDYGFDGDDDFDMAVGRAKAPTSQPYIVTVTNTNATTAFPCTILGAYSSLAFSAPNYQNSASISITMGIAGITYQEFLYQSMNKPFIVGQTYFQSSTANQVLETLTVIAKDVNGNESQKTLVPTIDPYQQQSNIIVLKMTYRVDGFTAVVISSVLASATVKLYFYPAETVSTARTLTGRRAVKGYSDPHTVKSQSLKLSGASLRALKGR